MKPKTALLNVIDRLERLQNAEQEIINLYHKAGQDVSLRQILRDEREEVIQKLYELHDMIS